MTNSSRRPARPALRLTALVAVAAGCVATAVAVDSAINPTAGSPTPGPGGPGSSAVRLVAYDSCESALAELRAAALPAVTAWGFPHAVTMATDGGVAADQRAAGAPAAAPPAGKAAEAAQPPAAPTPGHSGTNTHESDVDEPDLVKTDGKRIVSVVDGTLRVVDVATRRQTASLTVPGGPAADLMLDGDRALVLVRGSQLMAVDPPIDAPAGKPMPTPVPRQGSSLVLVDLRAGASVAGTLAVDGEIVDARAVGSVARVVVRSGPRLSFVYPGDTRSEEQSLAENREVIRSSTIGDWLPRIKVSSGATSTDHTVNCADVSHPASYTGDTVLTVLTVDITRELGSGDPVSVIADGSTVYATSTNLYVADQRVGTAAGGGFAPGPLADVRTGIHQFSIEGSGKPGYLASGSVPGSLLNQYAMSEYDGNLRIATTSGQTCCTRGPADAAQSESAVAVLHRDGATLVEIGRVGGLGKGERIYSVRFLGATAHVVTFRQTDPLYTVDLSDPRKPAVTGELKITGYSAYLHPAGDGRLIGVGQEASEAGRATGLQVSLFDTADPATPRRLAQFQLPSGYSDVEHDPHAFLYWPALRLIVLPVSDQDGTGALALRLDGDTITELGRVNHPQRFGSGQIRRAMVIGDELWTVSPTGVMASATGAGVAQRTWIPFS